MKKLINIHIGGLYVTQESVVISTVLGSCVAVCLYDPLKQIGGMNHILMPGNPDMKHFDSAARYGVNAMEQLINRIMAIGGCRFHLIAKIFGGAHLFPTISEENGIGQKNADFVLDFLKMENIRIVSSDLGGHASRKILFHTDTGDVYVKRISSTFYPKIAEQEKKLISKIKKQADKPTQITFF